MNIDTSALEGKWFAPDHPVTCANPAPWKIDYIKIRRDGVVLVRNEKSMWFHLTSCLEDTKENLEEWLKMKGWEE